MLCLNLILSRTSAICAPLDTVAMHSLWLGREMPTASPCALAVCMGLFASDVEGILLSLPHQRSCLSKMTLSHGNLKTSFLGPVGLDSLPLCQ